VLAKTLSNGGRCIFFFIGVWRITDPSAPGGDGLEARTMDSSVKTQAVARRTWAMLIRSLGQKTVWLLGCALPNVRPE